jgi:hypothetical protein
MTANETVLGTMAGNDPKITDVHDQVVLGAPKMVQLQIDGINLYRL